MAQADAEKAAPFISVIIPTYNRASILKKSVRSVLQQSYSNFELIIVDDCSTDGTQAMIQEIDDDRIRYVRNSSNLGAGGSRNRGVQLAEGNWIAFQDSDDEWYPDKLEKQVKALQDAPADCGLIYGGFFRVSRQKKEYIPEPWVKNRSGYIARELTKGNFISPTTVLVSKKLYEQEGGFNEQLRCIEDWELFVRLAQKTYVDYMDCPLVDAHTVDEGVSTNKAARVDALIYMFDTQPHLFWNNKDAFVHIFYVGNNLCRRGEMKLGAKYLSHALKLNPLSARCALALAVSLSGSHDAYLRAFGLVRDVKARLGREPSQSS